MTQPTGHTDPRDELIAGLRQLADWYEQHPDVPLPPYPDFRHCVLATDDDAGTKVVEEVAAALGVVVRYGEHVRAERDFAGVEFNVYYVTREQAAEHQRRWDIARAATVDPSAAAAAAEVPADLAPRHAISISDSYPSVEWSCLCGLRSFTASREGAEKAAALHLRDKLQVVLETSIDAQSDPGEYTAYPATLDPDTPLDALPASYGDDHDPADCDQDCEDCADQPPAGVPDGAAERYADARSQGRDQVESLARALIPGIPT